jgi:ribonuclease HI
VFFDGGSRGNPGPSAIGALVLDRASEPPTPLVTISERIGEATNNVAEYRALIAALEAARAYDALVNAALDLP